MTGHHEPALATALPQEGVLFTVPSTVYVAPPGHLGADPGTRQPAFRAWADALLVRLAPRIDSRVSSSIGIRIDGQIARLAPHSPFDEPLDVRDHACALALRSETLPLFRPTGWSEDLMEYLTDAGIAEDVIEEHLPVCAAPTWPARVDALPQVLAETRQDLLLLVARFFGPDVRRYLGSWKALPADAAPLDEPLEVVVSHARPEDINW